jgi:hypothetical protein
MRNFMAIRDEIYHHNLSEDGDLINFKSPYTLIKAVYYIETASIFLFITQAFIRSPNFITMLYVIAGVVGAFLLNSEQSSLFNLGIFLVFTKGTFDWADGPLARHLNKTSFLGHSFDIYGAHVIDCAFRVTFVYYTLEYYPDLMFLFPVIAFILLITKFNLFSDFLYYKNNIDNTSDNGKKVRSNEFEEGLKDPKNIKGFTKLYYSYQSILDARARSIDFLLLILLIDNIYDYNISKLLLSLSVLIILRGIVMYAAGVYLAFKVYKGSSNG